ncbi:MAG: nucleoside 2-deoxyribosyltransferase [Deltaproteobacteria bacterium]
MKIYFAHPCFTEEQKEFKNKFLSMLKSRFQESGHVKDIIIVDPFDHTPVVEFDPDTKLKMAEGIKIKCLALLDECDAVIALADWNDTGTAFEAGYAHAFNKPVILISRENCSAANAMLIGAAKVLIDHVLGESGPERLAGIIEQQNHGLND